MLHQTIEIERFDAAPALMPVSPPQSDYEIVCAAIARA